MLLRSKHGRCAHFALVGGYADVEQRAGFALLVELTSLEAQLFRALDATQELVVRFSQR